MKDAELKYKQTIANSNYVWPTFKANNQRTGYQGDIVTKVKHEILNFPREYAIYQNYPNPFNPSTTIEFDLPKTSEVTLKVFNILGEEVATLVSERLTAGNYKYEWDALNLASGVYLYRLEAKDFVETKKMILMR